MSGIAEPGPADLLKIARATLLQDIVPHLTGDARFKALMIANAMAIAGRAAQYGDVDDFENAAEICADIRAGRYDDNDEMVERLLAYCQDRCAISSKPAGKVGE